MNMNVGENLTGNSDDSGKWDVLRDKENLLHEYYDQAVDEIREEYEDKTPFEKKVMLDIVLYGDSEKRMTEEDYWKYRFPGPSKDRIKSEFLYDFNFGMNCGGFALEVFSCLFLKSKNIEDATQNVLEQFPFVRVLDDGGLREGEYPVMYRCNEHGGHHFVKMEGDKIIEKDGSGSIRDFVEWPDSLKDAPEVTFAVNRDHEIEPRDENGERIYSYFI